MNQARETSLKLWLWPNRCSTALPSISRCSLFKKNLWHFYSIYLLYSFWSL